MRKRKHSGAGDNRGLSVIEIILVVALIAILGSIIGGSVIGMYASYAKECASNIDALMSKARMDALSRQGELCLVLYKDSKGVQGEIYLVTTDEHGVKQGCDTPVTRETLGHLSVTVRYSTTSNPSTFTELSGTSRLYLSYSRSTGAFKTMKTAAGYVNVNLDDSYGVNCQTIEVISGERNIPVTLYPSTGKHKLY